MKPQDLVSNPRTAAGHPACPDRRRKPSVDRRMPYRVPCRVRLMDTGTGQVQTVVGETLNISTSGVALQVSADIPLGTWVETLVPHPGGDPMFLCGTVVHTRQTMAANYEIGVETNGPPTVS